MDGGKFVKIEEVMKSSEKAHGSSPEYSQGQLHRQMKSIGIEPGTLYQELEMSSRYVDTHQNVTWSNSRVNLHSHNF